jgi:hypothetical protein
MLYFYQGLILGFFLGALPEILANQGFSAEGRALLVFSALPFSLKFIWAPLSDTYYWRAFGKRKSYIVPAQYLASFILFIASFFIDNLIADQNLLALFIISLLLIGFMAIQDISVDGWSVKLLSE